MAKNVKIMTGDLNLIRPSQTLTESEKLNEFLLYGDRSHDAFYGMRYSDLEYPESDRFGRTLGIDGKPV